MSFLSSLNIVGSGLTAQQLRLDVAAQNITNANTTRTEEGGAYRRKIVQFEAQPDRDSFRDIMARTQRVSNAGYEATGGVIVTGIVDDPSELKLVYDPDHPDANEEGYVEMPNVDTIKEITDAIAASQAYAANVTVFNTMKSVISKGLEIGR